MSKYSSVLAIGPDINFQHSELLNNLLFAIDNFFNLSNPNSEGNVVKLFLSRHKVFKFFNLHILESIFFKKQSVI